MPQACIAAYAVVGPTKRKPRRLSSLDSAVDSGVTAGRSSSVARGAAAAARRVRPDQLGERHARARVAARALAIAASILPRWRTMPASSSRRSTSRSPKRRHRLDLEAGEGAAEVLALAQDRQPREAGLEALQHQPLVEAAVVGDRPAPLLVVVGDVVGRGGAPRAAAAAVGPGARVSRRSAIGAERERPFGGTLAPCARRSSHAEGRPTCGGSWRA